MLQEIVKNFLVIVMLQEAAKESSINWTQVITAFTALSTLIFAIVVYFKLDRKKKILEIQELEFKLKKIQLDIEATQKSKDLEYRELELKVQQMEKNNSLIKIATDENISRFSHRFDSELTQLKLTQNDLAKVSDGFRNEIKDLARVSEDYKSHKKRVENQFEKTSVSIAQIKDDCKNNVKKGDFDKSKEEEKAFRKWVEGEIGEINLRITRLSSDVYNTDQKSVSFVRKERKLPPSEPR